MRTQANFQYELDIIMRNHNESHRQDLRDFHQNLCDEVKQISPPLVNAEFHQMLIEYVESYHAYVVSIYPDEIHHSYIAKAIVMFFQRHDTLRLDVLDALEKISGLRDSLKLLGNSSYDAEKIRSFYEFLKESYQYLQEEKKYCSPEMNLPIGLQDLLSQLTQCYLPFDVSVCCLIYENEECRDHIHDKIFQDYIIEALDVIFSVLDDDVNNDVNSFNMIGNLYVSLINRKDKKLNQPDILLKLAINFEKFREKRFDMKPIIQYLVYSFKKMAKVQKLNDSIVNEFRKIEIYAGKNEGYEIKPSRLFDMQKDVNHIIYEYDRLD